MAYKAYLGPYEDLTPLVGYLGGVTQITSGHGAPPPPEPIPGSIDIRAVDVAYGNPSPSFGNDWDTSFPVTTSEQLRVVGFRFQVNIPPDATILSATLTAYQAQNATWSAADVRMLGAERVEDASQPTSWSNMELRYLNVGAEHLWSNSGTINNGQPVPTGDISNIVQEMVNSTNIVIGSWASGNHIMFWCRHPGNGGANHQWQSVVDRDPSTQPRLQVEYEYLP